MVDSAPPVSTPPPAPRPSGRGTATGRVKKRWLAGAISAVTIVAAAPGATAAPTDERSRRVAAEMTFEGVVTRAKAKNGTCRAQLKLNDIDGETRPGQSFSGDGVARTQFPCDDAPAPGTEVTGTVRAVLKVASSQGGTPDGYRATIAPRDVWDITLDVASHAGGTPDGFKATLDVASSAGGTPDG